jgi:hypothetical protein
MLILFMFFGCASGNQEANYPEAQRQALEKCRAGDKGGCAKACLLGAGVDVCSQACEAEHGEACEMQAAFLERQPDPDKQPNQVSIDDVAVTTLYEKACGLGVGRACLSAGERILNGRGRGDKTIDGAVNLLRRGCQEFHYGEACCGMVFLNKSLAASDGITPMEKEEFSKRAGNWLGLAEQHGGLCAKNGNP